MRIIFAAALSIVVAGCVATSNESFVGPSGGPTHAAKCSRSPQACFKAASDTCRGGYAVLDSHSNAGGLLADLIPGLPSSFDVDHQLPEVWQQRELPIFLTVICTAGAQR